MPEDDMLVVGLTSRVFGNRLTVSVAAIVWVVILLVVSVPVTEALNDTPAKALALEWTVKEIVVGEVVTVPDVDEAVSQLGKPAIEYPTLPVVALS